MEESTQLIICGVVVAICVPVLIACLVFFHYACRPVWWREEREWMKRNGY